MVKGDSDRGIKKFAQALRHTFGRNSVEPGFASNLTERNKSLSEFFEIKTFELKKKVSKKDKEERESDSDEHHSEDSREEDDEGYVTYTAPAHLAYNIINPALFKQIRYQFWQRQN